MSAGLQHTVDGWHYRTRGGRQAKTQTKSPLSLIEEGREEWEREVGGGGGGEERQRVEE